MKRKTWKWIFGLSLAGLILLLCFTVFLWVLSNVGAVLFRMLFILDEDLQVSGISFGQFMSNFVGSPLFYGYVADLAVLLGSSAALIISRKR